MESKIILKTFLLISMLVVLTCSSNFAFAQEPVDPGAPPGQPPPPPDQPPQGTLSIVKNTVGADGTFNFFVVPTPSMLTLTTQGNRASDSLSLDAGTYDVVEEVTEEWSPDYTVFCQKENGATTGDGGYGVVIEGGKTTICHFFNMKRPVITDISPSTATVGGPGFILTVNGSNFIPTSFVSWDEFRLATNYFSPTRLTSPVSSVPPEGVYFVAVTNVGEFEATSNSVIFIVWSSFNYNYPGNGSNRNNLLINPGFNPNDPNNPLINPFWDPNQPTGQSNPFWNPNFNPRNPMNPFINPNNPSINDDFDPFDPNNPMINPNFDPDNPDSPLFDPGFDSNDPDNPLRDPSQQGTLIVKKVMNGGTGSFTFTGTPNGTINANDGTISATVAPGTYNSTEILPANWILNSISCNDTNSFGSGNTATFNVAAGETVTCTFTNTNQVAEEPATHIITVNKTTIGGNGIFDFTASGPSFGPLSFDITTSGGFGSYNLVVPFNGTYNIIENVPQGWKKNQATDTCQSVTVAQGDISCSVTNEKITVQPPENDPPTRGGTNQTHGKIFTPSTRSRAFGGQ